MSNVSTEIFDDSCVILSCVRGLGGVDDLDRSRSLRYASFCSQACAKKVLPFIDESLNVS